MEGNLRDAHDVARLASWEFRPQTDEVTVFRALPESAISAGATASLEEFLALVPETERDILRADLAALVAGSSDHSTRRFRYELPSGEAWLETRCDAIRDTSGRLVVVQGTTQDVTEQELEVQRVSTSRSFLQATIDSLPYNIAVLSASGDVLMTNGSWNRYGEENGQCAPADEANYLDVCDAASGDEWAARAAAGLRAVLADPASPEFTLEYPCHSPDRERWFLLRAARYAGPGDAVAVITHIEITARREAERRVRFQASLVDAVDASVVATDDGGLVTYWSRGARDLYGWTAAEAEGRPLAELILSSDLARSLELDAKHDTSGRSEAYLTVCRKDGASFPAYVRVSSYADADGEDGGRIFVSIDISERVEARRKLLGARNHLRAVTDSMAEGLFTLDAEGRVTYMNQATERLLGWSRHELMGRKWHEVAHMRDADGSELPIEQRSIVMELAEAPVLEVEDRIFVHRSGSLLPVAYTASRLADPDSADGCVVVFSDISERKARQRRLRAEREKQLVLERITGALQDDRFLLYSQPILDLQTNEVAQNELLLRMLEPNGEVCAPGAFLGIAEESGLIRDIDRWVISGGMRMAAGGLNVQLNVSARSISDLTMIEHIELCLEETGAPPDHVVIEITETAIIADEQAAMAFAERLRGLGCKLALDDFGTGYGSFVYLKHLPVDFLKIDIEFVRDIATSASSRHVVEAVVALARSFGLQTIGEGVEDAETQTILRELGVDFAQGFHVGRPAPTAQIFNDVVSRAA
jgi:PAS domain S-box-containing protein